MCVRLYSELVIMCIRGIGFVCKVCNIQPCVEDVY